MRRILALAVIATTACGGDADARLVTNLYTNTCNWSGNQWLGVEQVGVALEYAPGALPERDLGVSVGQCTLDASLFIEEARPDTGEAIPRLDGRPRWSVTSDDGTLTEEATGLWVDSKSAQGGCLRLDEVAPGGLSLADAGVFDGVATPAPGEAGLISLDGVRDDEWTKTLQRGNPFDISWTTAGWDQSFVQIRQVTGGTVRQALTCNTTDLSTFVVSPAVWDQLDDIGAEKLEVYVAFQNVGETRARGDTIELVTRMVHVIEQKD